MGFEVGPGYVGGVFEEDDVRYCFGHFGGWLYGTKVVSVPRRATILQFARHIVSYMECRLSTLPASVDYGSAGLSMATTSSRSSNILPGLFCRHRTFRQDIP